MGGLAGRPGGWGPAFREHPELRPACRPLPSSSSVWPRGEGAAPRSCSGSGEGNGEADRPLGGLSTVRAVLQSEQGAGVSGSGQLAPPESGTGQLSDPRREAACSEPSSSSLGPLQGRHSELVCKGSRGVEKMEGHRSAWHTRGPSQTGTRGETGWRSLTPHPAPDPSERSRPREPRLLPVAWGMLLPGDVVLAAVPTPVCGPCWLSCGLDHLHWRDPLLTPVVLSPQVLGLRDVLHQAHAPARCHHGHRQLLHLPDEQEKGKGHARAAAHSALLGSGSGPPTTVCPATPCPVPPRSVLTTVFQRPAGRSLEGRVCLCGCLCFLRAPRTAARAGGRCGPRRNPCWVRGPWKAA